MADPLVTFWGTNTRLQSQNKHRNLSACVYIKLLYKVLFYGCDEQHDVMEIIQVQFYSGVPRDWSVCFKILIHNRKLFCCQIVNNYFCT